MKGEFGEGLLRDDLRLWGLEFVEELFKVGLWGKFHLGTYAVAHHLHATDREVHERCYLFGYQPHLDIDA